MLDPFELIAVDQDAIEAAVAIGFAEQVVLGGQHNAAALAGGDAGPGAAEVAATSLADFNKTSALPSRQIRSISPPRIRKLREITR
jgi:hypothetical protein